MVLLLFLSGLIISCLTFSWLKFWGKMTDSQPVTSSSPSGNSNLSQEPLAAAEGSGEPPQVNGKPKPAPHRGTRDAHAAGRRRNSIPTSRQKLPKPPSSPNNVLPSPETQAGKTGTQQLDVPDANGLPGPARPQGLAASAPSREDEKQEHIKRQLMTNFILGSFDDNSSDEDSGATAFRISSRKGSRASLGILSPEGLPTLGEAETQMR